MRCEAYFECMLEPFVIERRVDIRILAAAASPEQGTIHPCIAH